MKKLAQILVLSLGLLYSMNGFCEAAIDRALAEPEVKIEIGSYRWTSSWSQNENEEYFNHYAYASNGSFGTKQTQMLGDYKNGNITSASGALQTAVSNFSQNFTLSRQEQLGLTDSLVKDLDSALDQRRYYKLIAQKWGDKVTVTLETSNLKSPLGRFYYTVFATDKLDDPAASRITASGATFAEALEKVLNPEQKFVKTIFSGTDIGVIMQQTRDQSGKWLYFDAEKVFNGANKNLVPSVESLPTLSVEGSSTANQAR